MSDQRPVLIIIPGIGDDKPVYFQFARRWRRLGYDAHVISFKWVNITARLKPSLETFLRQLDRFGGRSLYIIGISAGGTAAVNALASRSNVQKVITVCAPLQTMPGLRNPLLIESIAQVTRNLASFTPQQKQRILSVHGIHDQVVDSRLSQVSGIANLRIKSVLHGPSIYLAMMLHARRLNRFFRR